MGLLRKAELINQFDTTCIRAISAMDDIESRLASGRQALITLTQILRDKDSTEGDRDWASRIIKNFTNEMKSAHIAVNNSELDCTRDASRILANQEWRANQANRGSGMETYTIDFDAEIPF